MFSVEKTKDGITFIEVLPFNPIVEGWDFISACCCSVEFRKGKDLMSVAAQKGYMTLEVKGERKVFALPDSHLEFQIKIA